MAVGVRTVRRSFSQNFIISSYYIIRKYHIYNILVSPNCTIKWDTSSLKSSNLFGATLSCYVTGSCPLIIKSIRYF